MNFARLAADRRANVTATYKHMQENNDHDYNIQRAVELENAHAGRHRMNDRGRLTTVHTRRRDAIVDQAQATRRRVAREERQARRVALIARRAERDARIAARAAERQGIADRRAMRARNRAARVAREGGLATDDATVVRQAVLGAIYQARQGLGTPHPPNSQADTPRQRWELAKLLVPRTPLGGQELQRYNLEGLTNDERRVRRTLAAALANPVLRASGNAKMTARILAHHPIGSFVSR